MLSLTAGLRGPSVSAGNPASVALRAKAAVQICNLDRDDAIVTFRQAIAADPQDAAAYRGLATALWLSITFRRGNMTVDELPWSRQQTERSRGPPPPEMVAAFRQKLSRRPSQSGGHACSANAQRTRMRIINWARRLEVAHRTRHRRWQRDGGVPLRRGSL